GSVFELAPEPLRLRPVPLLLEPTLTSGLGGRRGNPPPLDPEGPPELLHQALEGELPVSALAALVLGDRAQHRTRAGDDAPLLRLRERRRRFDVEDGFDPCLRLLRMLTAGAARAREPELDLPGGQNDGTGHPNRLAVHGCDSAGRRRCLPCFGRTDRGRRRCRPPSPSGRAS